MEHSSNWLRRGKTAWAFVGVVAAASIVYLALAQLSGLVVPLVVAAVMGVLFAPLVDMLTRVLPRPIASILVLIGLIALSFWTIAMTFNGIIEQAPEIGVEIKAGLESFVTWLSELGWDVGTADRLVAELEKVLEALLAGLPSFIGSAFSSVGSFLVGAFVASFLLYFILADWSDLVRWVGSHLGVSADLGANMIDDSVWALRKYFYVLSVSNIVVAVVIGVTMLILDLPLAATVAIVTFITAYVPYLGAVVSGVFAFLIALGAGNATDALIVLAVILVAQNVVQPLIQTKWTGDTLHLHPVVVFGSTIVGSALAGVLGATLSAPVVAILVSINKRLGEQLPPESTDSDPLSRPSCSSTS